MASEGVKVNALKNRPPITKEVDYLMSVYRSLNSLNGITGYCAFYNITDLDERLYLFRMTEFIKEQYTGE